MGECEVWKCLEALPTLEAETTAVAAHHGRPLKVFNADELEARERQGALPLREVETAAEAAHHGRSLEVFDGNNEPAVSAGGPGVGGQVLGPAQEERSAAGVEGAECITPKRSRRPNLG